MEIKIGSKWIGKVKDNKNIVLTVTGKENNIVWVKKENGDHYLSFITLDILMKFYDEIIK
jgi:hypothetical protein